MLHLRQPFSQGRMRVLLMEPSKVDENETELVRCVLCAEHVWVRKDRLDKHIGKIHSHSAASKKSFTTYHAHMASTFPPKVKTKPVEKPVGLSAGSENGFKLVSRVGSRSGSGRCAECGQDQMHLWHYSGSSQGPVDICSECKGQVFARSFGLTTNDSKYTNKGFDFERHEIREKEL